MNSITFRKLGPEDFDLLMSVPPGLFDGPLRADQTRLFLDDPLHLCVLAFDADLAVGMATGQINLHPDKAPALFINEVGVRDSHLRRGIGRAVSEHLIAAARELGCDAAWLATEHDNAPARALYAAMGGQETPVIYLAWDHPV